MSDPYGYDGSSVNPDPKEGFKELVDQAAYDYGHAGYTGTIAEKNDFVTVSNTPVLQSDVERWGSAYLDDHDHDKWGPAFHVPVCDAAGAIVGHFFFGYASS